MVWDYQNFKCKFEVQAVSEPGKTLPVIRFPELDTRNSLLGTNIQMNKKLFRTKGPEAMLLGVCGGLAKYLDADPTIIRIVMTLLTIFSFGGLILAYFIMAIIMPQEA